MDSSASDDSRKTPDEQFHEDLGELMKHLMIFGPPTNGNFKREFLMSFRNVHKVFAGMQCPLSPEEIQNLGLNQAARQRENWNVFRNKGGLLLLKSSSLFEKFKKANNIENDVTINDRDLEKVNKREHKKQEKVRLPPSTPNSWKPTRQRKEVVDISNEDAAFNKICGDVQSLLNKVTQSTKQHFITEFVSFETTSNKKLTARVAEMIVKKMAAEPRYCSIYMEIVQAKVEEELRANNGRSTLRNEVLTQLQAMFTKLVESTEGSHEQRLGVITSVGHVVRHFLGSAILESCAKDLFPTVFSVTRCNKPECEWKMEDIEQDKLHLGLHLIEVVGDEKDYFCSKMVIDELEKVKTLMSKRNLSKFMALKKRMVDFEEKETCLKRDQFIRNKPSEPRKIKGKRLNRRKKKCAKTGAFHRSFQKILLNASLLFNEDYIGWYNGYYD